MPAEAVVRHRETAELGDHVLAAGDVGDVALPVLEDRVALAGVRTDTERRAEVVEDHRGVGHGAGELEELLVLEVEVPRVVREASGAEAGDTGAERRIRGQPGGCAARDAEAGRGIGASERLADATEQSPARVDVRIENVVEVRAAAGRRGRRCRR